jgi:hypothetical protein
MGLGLLDGTQALTTLDLARIGGLPPSATRGVAVGYVGTSGTGGKVVRATVYAPQGANAQRSLVSSSVNDASAGTGAQQVTVSYLDTTFTLNQEVVTMNGTTAVNTVSTTIAFIEAMLVTMTGTTGGNVGTISIDVNTGGTGGAWGSIAATDNQTFWAQHYVPTGVTCYILDIYAGATAAGGATNLMHQQNPLATNLPQLNMGGFFPHGGPGEVLVPFGTAIPVLGPDFIFVNEKPGAATVSTAYATFEYVQF